MGLPLVKFKVAEYREIGGKTNICFCGIGFHGILGEDLEIDLSQCIQEDISKMLTCFDEFDS